MSEPPAAKQKPPLFAISLLIASWVIIGKAINVCNSVEFKLRRRRRWKKVSIAMLFSIESLIQIQTMYLCAHSHFVNRLRIGSFWFFNCQDFPSDFAQTLWRQRAKVNWGYARNRIEIQLENVFQFVSFHISLWLALCTFNTLIEMGESSEKWHRQNKENHETHSCLQKNNGKYYAATEIIIDYTLFFSSRSFSPIVLAVYGLRLSLSTRAPWW